MSRFSPSSAAVGDVPESVRFAADLLDCDSVRNHHTTRGIYDKAVKVVENWLTGVLANAPIDGPTDVEKRQLAAIRNANDALQSSGFAVLGTDGQMHAAAEALTVDAR